MLCRDNSAQDKLRIAQHLRQVRDFDTVHWTTKCGDVISFDVILDLFISLYRLSQFD